MIINKNNLTYPRIDDLIDFDLTNYYSGIKLSESLVKESFNLKKEYFGNVISYSPKVFIPLTFLCRDVCHYCTFAKTPKNISEPYMGLEKVLEISKKGESLGCLEALITLGDKPELRYKTARDYLHKKGLNSTIDYIKKASQLIIDETQLIPHLNPGCLTSCDIDSLKEVSGSMGLMIESHSNKLCDKGMPHYGSPDKDPEYRIQTLINAGVKKIPFTTGILIGIGESRMDRLESLSLINSINNHYGNIQEVIIQNFIPKPNTLMKNYPPAPASELIWTIAMARKLLDPSISIQVPPNLNNSLIDDLLVSGINDFGGISPLTIDHVNPESPWPEITQLNKHCIKSDQILLKRSTVYPDFINSDKIFLNKDIKSKILKNINGSGYIKEDSWIPGITEDLPTPFIQSEASHSIQKAVTSIENNIDVENCLIQLFNARDKAFNYLRGYADEIKKHLHGDKISFVVNRNINYTNVCMYSCSFCAFSKSTGSQSLRGKPYNISFEEIQRRVLEAESRGATEVCLQGGIHPKFSGNHYLQILKKIREISNSIHIHAFSPLEIKHGAESLGLQIEDFLLMLKKAGLNSLPGTAAEILDDEIRNIICPDKLNSNEWTNVITKAHNAGLGSTATIMFGHIESYKHLARHLIKIKDIQNHTNGFNEFVPLPFVANEAPMFLRGQSRSGPSFRESVLMHSISRILFNESIRNIQGSWVKMGYSGLSYLLDSGINDIGGLLMNESITSSAGAIHGQELDLNRIKEYIELKDLRLVQRNTSYKEISMDYNELLDNLSIPIFDLDNTYNLDAIR